MIAEIQDGQPLAFVDATVRPDRVWSYAVVAVNANGESAFSNIRAVEVPLFDATAPGNMIVSGATATTADIAWADNSSDETGFRIERSTNSVNWTTVTTTAPNVTRFQDAGLLPLRTYYYRVQAVKPDGNTDPANITFANADFPPDSSGGGNTPSSTPGEDPGDPPSAPPAGYPKGRPGVNANGKQVYKAAQPTLNVSSAVADVLITGSITFKTDWIEATSPQDAVMKSIENDGLIMQRKQPDGSWGPGQAISLKSGRFFKLSEPQRTGERYYMYLTGQSELDGKWNNSCISVAVTVPWVEADVDSKNDGGDPHGPGDKKEEDKIEAEADLPGKVLKVNDDDSNSDGIPDWVQGFKRDAGQPTPELEAVVSGETFTQLALRLASSLDLTKAKIKLVYPAANPATASRTGSGTAQDPYVYSLGGGPENRLRLWTKKGDEQRDARSATTSGGTFVNTETEYTAAQLGLQGNSGNLWIEGIRAKAYEGADSIKVLVAPDGSGPLGYKSSDEVRLTVTPNLIRINGNRDTGITFDWRDDKPYKVWINDDADRSTTNTDDETYLADIDASADSQDQFINSTRDLEDFFTLKLNLPYVFDMASRSYPLIGF